MKITVIEPQFELLTPRAWIYEYPRLIERAGRTCYKSEERITADSAAKFVRMIVNAGHESVLEHLSITALIIGDRTMSHQLVRHRIAAYSQESQRYCDYDKLGLQVVCPPSIGAPVGVYEWIGGGLRAWHYNDALLRAASLEVHAWLHSVRIAYETYRELREGNVPPEDARAVLPGCTKTEVVSTFNLRQWRHVLRERALNPKAQWQIRQIMQGILMRFRELLPDVFFDLVEEAS
jgi:thymidylate synthase (FAD)